MSKKVTLETEFILQNIKNYVSETKNGLLLSVKIKPHSVKDQLCIINNELVLSVRAEARENAANDRVIELFSQLFSWPKSKIFIQSGHRAKMKRILIKDLSMDDL